MHISMVLLAISALVAVSLAPAPAPPPAAEVKVEVEAEEVGPLPKDQSAFKWEAYNCESLHIDEERDTGLITARCPRISEDGKVIKMWSTLNLTDFLANDHGKLKWCKGGGAFDTCANTVLAYKDSEMPVLTVDCFVPGKKAQRTSLFLNEGIYNRNGILASYDGYGRALARHPGHPAIPFYPATLLPEEKKAPEDVKDERYHPLDESLPSDLILHDYDEEGEEEVHPAIPSELTDIFDLPFFGDDKGDAEAVKRDAADGSMAYDCKHLSLYEKDGEEGVITAKCPAVDGIGKDVVITSFLNLNKCLGNDNGLLAWRKNGNAFKSCENVYIADDNSDQPILAADCPVPGKKAARAVVRLSERVHNNHGVLACRA